MQVRSAERNPYADLMRVVGATADGPVIGIYDNCPIAAAVVDHLGQRFIYVGVAPRRPGGQYDFTALRPGEWIAEPGLVYVSDLEYRHSLSPSPQSRLAGRALRNLREALIGWLH